MKLLIVTRADDNILEMQNLTFPILKKFAVKWNADFLNLGTYETPCAVGEYKNHYRIMNVYNLFDKYDRILSLDTDVVINKHCPNIFELVPENYIGTIFEDKGSRQKHRRQIIHQVQQKWGNVGWTEGYFNSGVFVVSKMHRDIFKSYKEEYWTGFGYDDVHFAYLAHSYGFNIYELPFQFNHMSMFSEEWNDNANRFKSYIIHYAGQGNFSDKGKRNRLQLMREDINKIWNQ